MSNYANVPAVKEQPQLLLALSYAVIAGCILLPISILIADFVVPNHDWIADTISDLGAGRYEFIVDTGIYAFSASLLFVAMLSTHVHLGTKGWSLGTVCFGLASLIVFLIGARNEYGDQDNEGVVIHIYLVYALGVLLGLAPFLMARGMGRVGTAERAWLMALGGLWVVCAPVFFFLPTDVDGIYERFLGLIAIAINLLFARVFILRARALQAEGERTGRESERSAA